MKVTTCVIDLPANSCPGSVQLLSQLHSKKCIAPSPVPSSCSARPMSHSINHFRADGNELGHCTVCPCLGEVLGLAQRLYTSKLLVPLFRCVDCLTAANAVVNNLQSTKQGVGKIEGREQKRMMFPTVTKDVICSSLSGNLGIVTFVGH